MRIAIIGANGQLGTELCRSLRGDVHALCRPACDVTEPQGLAARIEAIRPAWVVNCAAWTDVDGCERDPETALRVNAAGAVHVARAAEHCGAVVLYISTDYVFGADLARRTAYVESDRPAPLNQYGVSKLAGEHATLIACSRTLIVRTAGLYGSAGARGKGGNFGETMLRLAREGQPLRVVDDQWVSPTSALECARRCALLIERNARGVVHVAPADSCTWHEFARGILECAGSAARVEAIRSRDLNRAAARAPFGALASERLAELRLAPSPGWRAQIREYVEHRAAPAVNA